MEKEKLICMLTQELQDAEALVRILEEEQRNLKLPEEVWQETGKLMIKESRGYQQFYIREHKGRDGLKTVPRRNQEYINNLATKQYFGNLICSAKENKDIADKLLKLAKEYHDLNRESEVYTARFPMVTETSLMTKAGFLNHWKQTRTQLNPYRPEEKCYPTHDGAMVRSKSEQSVYNELLKFGIPFQYELELRVNGKTYYPDFTLLDVVNRKEVYYEHFGLLSDANYRLHYFQKTEAYMTLGLTYGTDYFCTFEDANYPFDIRKVTRFLEKRFPELGE